MSVMKLFRRFACPVVLSVLSLVANLAQVQAATQYFDTNGTTTGSGVTAAGSYSWEGTNWNTAGTNDANAANGVSATGNWTEGNFPRFAAGIDANGLTYTVTASANHTVAGMQLLLGVGFTGGPAVNGGATVNVNSSGGAVLSVAPGLQGLFVSTGGNLKINAPLGGVDATSALQWSGGGGSAYLYGANTFQGGVSLNSANGLNFNNSQSFGTGPITWNVATVVLANPDTTAPVTIANSMTIPAVTTATRQIIYTGHDAVTFSDWTLGDSPTGFPTFGNQITVANNAFTTAKLIINNLKGTPNSNLIVGGQAATNGTLVLTGTSTYGGAGNGGTTIIGSNTTGNPALQADEGAGLPTNSFLLLNGGVLQTSGSFTRPLAASFGQNMSWNIGGGGFSAIGSQLTVDIGGAGGQLQWGDSTLATGNPDLGSKILGPLKFGSVGSNAKTLFLDPIDLNPAGVASPARTVTVTAGVVANGGGGDSTELSGVISSSADPGGTPATLIKNGTGTLILSATNTYTGATTIAAGTLSVAGVGLAAANSNIGTNGTIHLGATTTAGTLKYTGTGETSDKVIDLAGTTGGGGIDQSGTGLLKFTSNLTAVGAGAKTLTLQGSTAGTGEIDGTIVDSSSATAVTKAGTGKWTLPNANTYTGATTVSGGTLAIGNDSSLGTTGQLSLAGGTIASSGGARNIANNAIISTGNGTVGGADNFTFGGSFTNSTASRTLTVSNSGTTTFGTVNLSEAAATGRTLTVTGAGNITFGGVIQNAAAAGAGNGGLTFNASYSGTATVNGTNTYTGTTTLSAGTFVLGNKAAFGTGTIAANGASISASTNLSGANAIANATVNLGGNNTFTGTNSIQFGGTATATASRTITNNLSSGNLTFSGPVNLSSNANNNTLTVGGTGSTSITGAIANGGTATASILTMSGSGTLGLSGLNTYAGGTNVNSGVVSVSGAAATLGTGNVTVLGTVAGTSLAIQSGVTNAIADTATLSLLGGGTAGVPDQGYADLGAGINELVASLVLGGVTQAGGTYGGTGSSATNILPEYFAADTGIVTVPSSCSPGDLNCDGHVDAQDYVFWRKNGGTPGDANYTAWRTNFGTPPGAGSGGGLGANGGAVPEPSSIALLVLGLVAVAARRRER